MLILAPMQGLTELLFRRAFHRCYPGAFDYAVSPFLSLTHGNLKVADKKIEDVLPQLNVDSMPVIPQLLGHETDEFIDLSNRLFDLGYTEVNWNMGCPMRRVAGKHRGSGILPHPDEVRAILEQIVPNIKPQLSVKIRLGYYSENEIDNIIPVLNDFPLKDVTIHPRIGKQVYSGRTNLDKLSEVLPSIRHKVIYNGDINSVFDYSKIRTLFPQIKDVMIGRGVLYNPLLPIQIRQQCSSDFDSVPINGSIMPTKDFILFFMEEIMRFDICTQAKIRKIKEYWCLLSKALPGSEESKRKVLHASDLDAIIALIRDMTK
ncbi:MAG: tRNA-dihydrouridine synthase family protein [Bacteroidales bacterium]|nr:tRNA-dihydrouridine synthase family protein [Bacteroidales bacterium]